jgi:hypothetical protein
MTRHPKVITQGPEAREARQDLNPKNIRVLHKEVRDGCGILLAMLENSHSGNRKALGTDICYLYVVFVLIFIYLHQKRDTDAIGILGC